MVSLTELYVCQHCNVAHAPVQREGEDELESGAPASCGACGHDDLREYGRVDSE